MCRGAPSRYLLSDLERFLDQQKTGTHDSEGVFTLDPSQAREKLRQFQLPVPEYSWLKIIQAAVAWKASRVTVRSSRTVIEFELLGLGDLGDIRRWVNIFADPLQQNSPAERHLAVGCMAALKLAEKIDWSYDRDGERQSLAIDTKSLRLGFGPSTGKPAILRFAVIAGTNVDLFFRNCRYSPVEIVVNRASVWAEKKTVAPHLMELAHRKRGQGAFSIPALPERNVQPMPEDIGVFLGCDALAWSGRNQPRARLILFRGLAASFESGARWRVDTFVSIPDPGIARARKSRLYPIVDGVTLSPVELDLPHGVEVLACNPELSLDLSGFAVIANNQLKEFEQSLRIEVESMVTYLRRYRSMLPPLPISFDLSRPHRSDKVGPWRLLQKWDGDSAMEQYVAVPTTPEAVPWKEAIVTLYPRDRRLYELRVKQLYGRTFPGVNPILAHGVDGEHLYTVEPVPRGVPLSELLPLSLQDGHLWLQRLAQLAAISNDRGLLLGHRLIPKNIITEKGEIVLTEAWGRAGLEHGYAGAALHGISGAPWKAPEELTGDATPSADQYRLGLLGYLLLTGKHPFLMQADQRNIMSVLFHAMNSPPPDPRELTPELPDSLAEALLRAIQKTPDTRFPSIKDFVEAIMH